RHVAVRQEGGDVEGEGVLEAPEAGAGVSPVTVIIHNEGAQPGAQPVAQPMPGPYVSPCGAAPWGGGGWIGGGIVGGFKYPDHLFFLGYDPRNSVNVANPPAPGDVRLFQPPPAPAPKGK